MADILSQEEIDALLDVVEDDYEDDFCSIQDEENMLSRNITLYDFKRPDRIRQKEFKYIRGIFDIMARNIEINFTSLLGEKVEVQLHSLDQMLYTEFLMCLPRPTYFSIFEFKPFEGYFALELNPSIAFAIIDVLLGGKGENFQECRYFTNIELKLLDNIVNVIFDSLKNAWKEYMETLPVLTKSFGHSTSLEYTNYITKNNIVIVVVIEIVIGNSSGMLNIALPVNNIDVFMRYLSNSK